MQVGETYIHNNVKRKIIKIEESTNPVFHGKYIYTKKSNGIIETFHDTKFERLFTKI